MPRICLSVALITIFTAAGMLCSLNLKKRCNELSLIISMLDEITASIRFNGSRLAEIIGDLREINVYADGSFLKLISEYTDNNRDISECWISASDKALYIDEKDRRILKSIGLKLGGTDTEGQLSMLEYNTSVLRDNLNDAENKRAEKSRVFMTVSTLSGIGLGIIIL